MATATSADRAAKLFSTVKTVADLNALLDALEKAAAARAEALGAESDGGVYREPALVIRGEADGPAKPQAAKPQSPYRKAQSRCRALKLSSKGNLATLLQRIREGEEKAGEQVISQAANACTTLPKESAPKRRKPSATRSRKAKGSPTPPAEPTAKPKLKPPASSMPLLLWVRNEADGSFSPASPADIERAYGLLPRKKTA